MSHLTKKERLLYIQSRSIPESELLAIKEKRKNKQQRYLTSLSQLPVAVLKGEVGRKVS